MKPIKDINNNMNGHFTWQVYLLVLLAAGSLVFILNLAPIIQEVSYHQFADSRQFTFIPNFLDVLSNLPFFLIGVYGYLHCKQAKSTASRNAWLVMFIGISIVSFGSAYYHWQPSYDALFWDRLPMTIAFMGLFIAILSEYVSEKIAVQLLLPSIIFGGFSVLYWYFTDDLRLYLWVQLVPLLTIPVVMLLFKSHYSHQSLLLLALVFYILAKISELYDAQIFQLTHEVISGHTIKHLLAAISCYCLLTMLERRERKST